MWQINHNSVFAGIGCRKFRFVFLKTMSVWVNFIGFLLKCCKYLYYAIILLKIRHVTALILLGIYTYLFHLLNVRQAFHLPHQFFMNWVTGTCIRKSWIMLDPITPPIYFFVVFVTTENYFSFFFTYKQETYIISY